MITILDGYRKGKQIEISDKEQIAEILGQINQQEYRLCNIRFNVMGYHFIVTMLDEDGKRLKEITLFDRLLRCHNLEYSLPDDSLVEYIDKLYD